MVVFLGLSSGGNSKGTVEIDHLEWPGGEVSDNWEWMGGPDGYDGGTWEWGSLYGKPCMDLTSNLSGGLVAKVFSRVGEATYAVVMTGCGRSAG
jgi:hypothetical protein